VKGVIHWVSAEHAVSQQVRLFDRLFTREHPEADKEIPFTEFVNADSLQEVSVLCEPSLAEMAAGEQCQFERIGYFCVDNKLSKPGSPVFNRTVALRDSWAKTANQ
jgi:glutaminyl-tRNA synthetase